MRRLKDNPGFWLLIMVMISAIAIFATLKFADAQEQYKPVVPFSKTSWTIEPYYEFKPTVAAFTVKAKGKDYCPPENNEYQCPADYEPIEYFREEAMPGEEKGKPCTRCGNGTVKNNDLCWLCWTEDDTEKPFIYANKKNSNVTHKEGKAGE